MKQVAPDGITAAVDLFGTETIETALSLGLSPDRIVAESPLVPIRPEVHALSSATTQVPDAVPQIAARIVAQELTVPIAATFPLESRSAMAAAMQADRHTPRQDRGHALTGRDSTWPRRPGPGC